MWKKKVSKYILIALILPTFPSPLLEARSDKVLREFQEKYPCPVTGKTTGPCPGYVKDHIMPLCFTGVEGDIVENLRWEKKEESYKKDILERKFCAKVKKCE